MSENSWIILQVDTRKLGATIWAIREPAKRSTKLRRTLNPVRAWRFETRLKASNQAARCGKAEPGHFAVIKLDEADYRPRVRLLPHERPVQVLLPFDVAPDPAAAPPRRAKPARTSARPPIPDLAAGWGAPEASARWHYFPAAKASSLCLKWIHTTKRWPDLAPGSAVCLTCSRKLAKSRITPP